MPYLYQTDPAWAAEPYAGGTVEENGCGPTCLAMVYVDLTGKKDLDPAGMSAFSVEGWHVDSGLTSWTLMTDGAAFANSWKKSLGRAGSSRMSYQSCLAY